MVKDVYISPVHEYASVLSRSLSFALSLLLSHTHTQTERQMEGEFKPALTVLSDSYYFIDFCRQKIDTSLTS